MAHEIQRGVYCGTLESSKGPLCPAIDEHSVLKISNLALLDGTTSATVALRVADQQQDIVIAHLSAAHPQHGVDLVLQKEDSAEFVIIGKNKNNGVVHVTGYIVADDSNFDEDESDYDLEESDYEGEESDSEREEGHRIHAPNHSEKYNRPVVTEESSSSDLDASDEESKPVKSTAEHAKQNNKKRKGAADTNTVSEDTPANKIKKTAENQAGATKQNAMQTPAKTPTAAANVKQSAKKGASTPVAAENKKGASTPVAAENKKGNASTPAANESKKGSAATPANSKAPASATKPKIQCPHCEKKVSPAGLDQHVATLHKK